MNLRAKCGFTLIELMIVVIIIAALASMVAPRLIERSDEAKGKIALGDISSIGTALKLYRLDTNSYPTSDQGLKALMTQPSGVSNWKGPYLEQDPVDPWGNPYQYKCPGLHNTGGFDLFSTGRDGVESADDVINWK